MDFVPYMTVAQIETLLHGLALAAAGVGFIVGLSQYMKAQTWKKHEFVATAVRDFEGQPLVRNAMLMIDWGTRYIELYPSHPEYPSRFVLVNRPLLHTALMTHDKIGRPYSVPESAIRDSFDAFFNGLERLEQFIQANLVQAHDFRPYLAYWIQAVCEDANPELRQRLNDYVKFYRFSGVTSLFARYGKVLGAQLTEPSTSSRQEIQDQYESQVELSIPNAATPSNTR